MTNLCKKIIEDFFNNEEVKKHINIDDYKNIPVKETIKNFNNTINNSNSDFIVNCIINSNFIITEYTQIFKNGEKNIYSNANYHCKNKHLYFTKYKNNFYTLR